MRVFVISLLPFLLIELFREQFYSVMDSLYYLAFHNLTEFFSIVVSFSIFGITWYSYEQSQNQHSLFLGTIFLGMGLMDLMHVLGYSGMPAFITANSPLKSTQYWTAARLYMATGFLTSAYIYPGSRCIFLSKTTLFSINLLVPALVFCAVTYFPQQLPVTIIVCMRSLWHCRNNRMMFFKRLFLVVLNWCTSNTYGQANTQDKQGCDSCANDRIACQFHQFKFEHIFRLYPRLFLLF